MGRMRGVGGGVFRPGEIGGKVGVGNWRFSTPLNNIHQSILIFIDILHMYPEAYTCIPKHTMYAWCIPKHTMYAWCVPQHTMYAPKHTMYAW